MPWPSWMRRSARSPASPCSSQTPVADSSRDSGSRDARASGAVKGRGLVSVSNVEQSDECKLVDAHTGSEIRYLLRLGKLERTLESQLEVFGKVLQTCCLVLLLEFTTLLR